MLEAGADSAAVVTDVLRHADPEAQARAWVTITKPWRRDQRSPLDFG
jgi:thiamine monophosphate synthase